MEYRLLGSHTGLRVSELAMGASMFGNSRGYGATPGEAQRIMEVYADAGGNFIDTSDQYQLGESEQLVGNFLRNRRTGFVLSTKYTFTASASPAIGMLGNNRKAMVQSVEQSLKRLGTDYIDIYFAHAADGVTPVDEIMRGFEDLGRAGKILYGGLSNFPAWRIATAATLATERHWAPLAAVQLEYSLVSRAAERELLPMTGALGIGVMGYSPLGGGILTGKYLRGEKGRATEFLPGMLNEKHEALIGILTDIAAAHHCNTGQVAIAWSLHQGVVPILGARTVAQLENNLAASTIKLTEEQLARLDAASAIDAGYPHVLLAAQTTRLTAGMSVKAGTGIVR